jgi:hypothetical protein
MSAVVLICEVGTCATPAQPEHSPCCSSTFHGKSFCCEHYCRSHFVEAHPCSPESHPPAVEWPCDNYEPPLTCLTAPSTVTGRCTPCVDASNDAEMERLVTAEREARAGL